MLTTAPTTVDKAAPMNQAIYNANPITPADGTDLAAGPDGSTAIGLQVTGAGNVNVNLTGGGTAVLTGLVAGQRVMVPITRILATSTTATGISAIYR